MQVTRREFLRLVGGTILAAGALGAPGLLPARRLVRPPGAVEEKDFQYLCIRCGRCVERCPTKGLLPASVLDGWRNAGTPVLARGCLLCLDCIDACPTGALQRIPQNQARMGTVLVEAGMCIGCGKCVDPCRWKALLLRSPGQPVLVLGEKCVGCGLCIDACPVPGSLRLTPTGERRVAWRGAR